MDTGTAIRFSFQLIMLAGFAVTAVRLSLSGLHRKYRVFFAYLIFSTVQALTALLMNTRSPTYARVWLTMEPVLWIFYFLVVLELYRLVLERHRGLLTLGRWALYACMPVSIVNSLATLLPNLGNAAFQRSRLLLYYSAIERGVVFSLLIFLFLILVMLSRYPVHLSRNVVVHCVVYSAFFLSNSLGLFLYSVFGRRIDANVSTALMGITSICVLLWAFLLNPRGEAHLISVAQLDPDQEERVLDKLNSLNRAVLKAAQK